MLVSIENIQKMLWFLQQFLTGVLFKKKYEKDPVYS